MTGRRVTTAAVAQGFPSASGKKRRVLASGVLQHLQRPTALNRAFTCLK